MSNTSMLKTNASNANAQTRIDAHKQALFCADKHAIDDYRQMMMRAVDAVCSWLYEDGMYHGGSVKSLQQRIKFTPNKDGVGLKNALDEAITQFLHNSLKVHHVHSLAHLHCPTMVASQIAEVLINATNQSMDSWDQSPAGSFMEVRLIEWLRQKVGYDASDAGIFTSGGTQSNLMGLMLARDLCVHKHFSHNGAPHSVQTHGLPPESLDKIKVICSQNAHFSVQKNMALMGLGFNCVVPVAVNSKAQMDVQALKNTLDALKQEGKIIACIVATAGTTDAGAIDDLVAMRNLADAYDAWLHVDAAWGGALLLSQKYRQLLHGIDLADSITLDFHKHFFQTISCGAFLLKEAKNYRFMHYEAEYLNSAYDEAHGVPNLVSKSLQTTRRFDALKFWLTMNALGEDLYASMIDHGVDLTKQVADYIKQHEALELLVEPSFASVLFRVMPKDYPVDLIDALNQNVADELFAKGLANIGVTRVADDTKDVQSLKMTTLSPIATFDDVKTLLDLVIQTAKNIQDAIVNGNYTPVID